MIYMMQILRLLNKRERETLVAAFSDLSFEIEELGYEGLEDELISDMLFNHFGIEMQEPKQLRWLTDWVLEKQNQPQIWESLLKTVNLQMGA